MTKMKATYIGELKVDGRHESGAEIRTDAPKDSGGEGVHFSPTDLFAWSLGSCMLTMMALAAKKVGFDLKGTTVEVEKTMSLESPRRIGTISVRICSPGSPSAPIREKLEKAALHCPVHESLHPEIRQEIDFIWGL